MKAVFLLLASLVFALPAQAQWPRDQGERKPPSQMSREDRERLREDVDSARGTYGRRDPRREERMAPEERERLRRDVQDANKEMRRRR